MDEFKIDSSSLPGLYRSADQASLYAQSAYFWGLRWYLLLLIGAAFISYSRPSDIVGALISSILFLVTLGILIYIRVKRPDDIWYNGRAVAESVKTRSWRWMMRAGTYGDSENIEVVSKRFVDDLKAVLDQNKSLSHSLQTSILSDPISETMKEVRALTVYERLKIYVEHRIIDQANWYWFKSAFNKRRAKQCFWVSVVLHVLAIIMLLCRVKDPSLSLPVEVVATAAGAALTWLQAKKYNELNSAYALAAHEVILIKEESNYVSSEKQLSEYVINSEAAFSREHTQWTARKMG
ncbi:DUF4231 domain-containing protein [Marinobacterium sp. CAU 1594]|nr:DUF4231 domain-containing protein [Marinobacterium arenosum]